MWLHIALIMELLTMVICLHCIYGQKVKWDIKTVGLVASSLLMLELANFDLLSSVGGLITIATYIITFWYCKSRFHSSVKEIIISMVIVFFIIASMQFLCYLLINAFLPGDKMLKSVLVTIVVLAFTIGILPKVGLHRLRKSMCKKSKFTFLLFGFMGLILLSMMVPIKLGEAILIPAFVLVVPAIIMLLFVITKLDITQNKVEKMEEEIRKVEETTQEYDSLLTDVRLRQHEFKNHMAAIYSTHYTHKTYEELVRAQEEYCEKLMNENKYNNLLLLGNNVLAGYLYGKFQEAEERGTEVKYKVAAKLDKSSVPTYHIIEMLGILLDNALEALEASEEKTISFEVCETEGAYQISVMNPFRYVPYDEILKWFQLDKSEKGSGRGLGLYYLKSLCEEWKCDIGCRNVETDQKNWIVFRLTIGKTDSE